MATPTELSPIAQALGRVPTGLYLVTAATPGGPIGFVGSFVMQMGFAPPTVCVGVGKSRPHLADMRRSGGFALSILDGRSRPLMAPFLRKLPQDASPFDGMSVRYAASGSPVLADALAWVDCKITGEFDTADHTTVFGEVVEGALLREGEPSMHVRKNGLGY
jgi:flavin reductase (DIM6/NTAB) family NADH-FMN oxidoreductase RutF